jgi:hypothetical protein
MGPYSAENIIKVFNNIRIGQRLSAEVLFAGYAPFCPWLDYQLQLQFRNGECIDIQDYYDYSVSWLLASDCCLLDEGRMLDYRSSIGTQNELAVAERNNIRVYTSLGELISNEPKRREIA